MNEIRLVIDGREHERTDDCPECWRDPIVCSECGGRKHVGFIDESYDSPILGYLCEQCGDTGSEDE